MTRSEELSARLKARPERTHAQRLREKGETRETLQERFYVLRDKFPRHDVLFYLSQELKIPLAYLDEILADRPFSKARKGVKLSADNVRMIRKARESGVTAWVVAERYGISPNTVTKITAGKIWRTKEAGWNG